VVYDIQDIMEKKGASKTSLVSIEELFPFPET